jgi:hypothetical protein
LIQVNAAAPVQREFCHAATDRSDGAPASAGESIRPRVFAIRVRNSGRSWRETALLVWRIA